MYCFTPYISVSHCIHLWSVIWLSLPPTPSPFPLSVSVCVARGHFVTESTSFSHLVAAIQWWECTNKRIRQGWHLATRPSPSHRHRHTVSLSHILILTHTFSLPLLSHPLTLQHTLTHTHWHCGSLWPAREQCYTSLCPGNPSPAHYPAPLRRGSLWIRTPNDAASLRAHRCTH